MSKDWRKLPPLGPRYERIPDEPTPHYRYPVRMCRCRDCGLEMSTLGIGYHNQALPCDNDRRRAQAAKKNAARRGHRAEAAESLTAAAPSYTKNVREVVVGDVIVGYSGAPVGPLRVEMIESFDARIGSWHVVTDDRWPDRYLYETETVEVLADA